MKGSESTKCVLTSQRDIFFQGFLYKASVSRHGLLKVHPRAVLFGMFVKMYIQYGCYGGRFLKIMKDANVSLF